ARIDLPQADPSRDRRSYPRVGKLEFCIVDRPLVRLNRSFVLLYCCRLSVELLLWNRILAVQNPVTFEIHFRICEERLVSFALTFGLRELNLKRTRVDFRDQI